ncbi:cell envelope biogenesis protein OmpA [Brevundimonas sp. LM2]|uniref:OmpA family protein n=1 Tax=Brevundimonas sp. LM2 TaxID=1938605 RepID=UPI000983A60E|nr:OmpA family protein [Brevundimonas sp. LM2]AQR63015.1 cell envelope biogenesis protein OmpA [Brevundimonas sp. LM2]
MKIKLLASVAAMGLMAAGAASAEPDGWYGAVDAGYHFAQGQYNVEAAGNGVNWQIDANDGWAAFARLGYRFNPNWRVELEGGYRSGDVGTIRHSTGTVPSGVCNFTPATGACFSPEGDVESTTLMANVIYDIGGEYWGVRPFVGLGVGVNRVNTDFTGTIRGQRGVSIVADDSSTKFAAQALAGLSYAVGDRANIDLTYRYLTGEFEFDTTTSSALAVNNYGTFEGDYDDSHTVTLGLRYAFGADEAPMAPPPPPPPPPAAAPPPPPPPPPAPRPTAREFVVYFDWDRSDLTAEARSVVTQAATYAKSGQPTRVLVVGYADTSGSAAYNVGLSNRRARTVADALVSNGVNGGVIALDGKGETNLARPTADGVREPLNRRATIGINF